MTTNLGISPASVISLGIFDFGSSSWICHDKLVSSKSPPNGGALLL